MPASRHQDHTTLLSARGAFVSCAVASNPSLSPTFSDDGQRPFSGEDGRRNARDLRVVTSEATCDRLTRPGKSTEAQEMPSITIFSCPGRDAARLKRVHARLHALWLLRSIRGTYSCVVPSWPGLFWLQPHAKYSMVAIANICPGHDE